MQYSWCIEMWLINAYRGLYLILSLCKQKNLLTDAKCDEVIFNKYSKIQTLIRSQSIMPLHIQPQAHQSLIYSPLAPNIQPPNSTRTTFPSSSLHTSNLIIILYTLLAIDHFHILITSPLLSALQTPVHIQLPPSCFHTQHRHLAPPYTHPNLPALSISNLNPFIPLIFKPPVIHNPLIVLHHLSTQSSFCEWVCQCHHQYANASIHFIILVTLFTIHSSYSFAGLGS